MSVADGDRFQNKEMTKRMEMEMERVLIQNVVAMN